MFFFFFFSLLLRCYIRKPKPYSYRVCSIYFTLIPHFSFIDLQNINCFQIGVMLEEKHSYFTATPLHHQDNTDLQCSRSQRERRLSTMPNFLLLNHLDVFLQYRGGTILLTKEKKKKKEGEEQEDVGRRGGKRGEKCQIPSCPYRFSEIISELKPFGSSPLKRLTSSAYL